jgi:hypothetical protein
MRGNWYIYDNNTGEILGKVMRQSSDLPILDAGESYIVIPEGLESPSKLCIDVIANPPVVIERLPMSITYNTPVLADGIEVITVTGIPIGCHVGCMLPEGYTSATIDTGSITITSDTPGEGVISFRPTYHLAEAINVEFI